MKDNFVKCLEMLLDHEKGFINHPRDPGGMTNLGVTKKVYEKWVKRKVTEQEMRDLKPENVAPIYKTNYWDAVRGDDLPSGLDWAAFDWGVNSGNSAPAKAIQRCVGVSVDGAIGPMTLKAVADHDPEKIITYLYDVRQKYYESLSTFDVFGRGWSARNKSTLKSALELSKPF